MQHKMKLKKLFVYLIYVSIIFFGLFKFLKWIHEPVADKNKKLPEAIIIGVAKCGTIIIFTNF